MINKSKSLTQDNKVKLIIPILIAVLGVVGYFGKGLFESSSKPQINTPVSVTHTASQGGVIQKSQNGQNVVNSGSGTINIGITPEQSGLGLKQNKDKFNPVPPNETKLTVTQTTSGDSSPAVSDTKGDVIINITGSGTGKQP